ncbi:MAG: tRNA lysidine(34) synthetase TilS [Muribaculum sp.]|nr:tRNA lysidine(34) synthetase TilS [Muribaculum sp.]
MSYHLIDKIKGYIQLHNLIAPSTGKLLIGLSGGADSMSLLLILREIGYECVAAHCNFHLRGEESQRDEDFCRNLCNSLNIELLIKDFDVRTRQHISGESLEMACRTLRYDWWNTLLESGKADLIAVGHHLEDNIETFFINLLRGTGITGLKGMLPKSGRVIRPLLGTKRSEIEDFLQTIGVDYVIDSTNNECEYQRNKIRNIIIPQIVDLFPGAVSSMGNTINYLRDNYELYTEYIEILRNKYIKIDSGIDVSKIVTDEPHAKMALYEIIRPMGFNMTHVNNIISAFDNNGQCDASGRYFTNSQSVTLILQRGILKVTDFSPTDRSDESIEKFDLRNPSPCNGLFETTIISKDEFKSLKNKHNLSPNSLYLDYEILKYDHDFSLRSWKPGDRIRPYGMKGSKLLSDIFSDAKLSFEQKRKVRVLTCDDNILWVIGIRASCHFAVTHHTDKVLVLTHKK